MESKISAKTLLTDILFDIVGCFGLAVSVQTFSAPNNLAPGGVSGIAILVNYLFGLPISLVSLLLNIPLLILAWLFLGRAFTLKTIKSVAIMTVLLELCANLPVYQGNMILAALYAGVCQGVGLALVFMRSSTTGGTDVASRLIQLRFPHVPVGTLMIAVDGLVLIASAVVYRNIENALYAMIVIFVGGRIIDSLLYGLDTGKVMMIISVHQQQIARKIHDELERGCTVLDGRGSYTGSERPVLLCAVRKQQYIELKKIVWSVDPNAFMFALEATEIIGEGFKGDIK